MGGTILTRSRTKHFLPDLRGSRCGGCFAGTVPVSFDMDGRCKALGHDFVGLTKENDFFRSAPTVRSCRVVDETPMTRYFFLHTIENWLRHLRKPPASGLQLNS